MTLVAIEGGGRALESVRAAGVPVREFGVSGLGSLRVVPRLIRERGWQRGVIVSWAPSAHAVGALVARSTRTPHLINWHRQPGFPMTTRQSLGMRMAAELGAGAIAVTETQTPDLVKLGVPASRIRVVPNGTAEPAAASLDRATARGLLGLDDEFVVAVVARLRPEKRHTDLLKALALMHDEGRDVHAILVGDGPCEAELRSEAAERRVRVTFTGYQEDPSVYIAASDVACLSSEFEALPMSLIEAAAAGRATVATNVGGTCEIVHHGVTGLVVPARDPRALADALTRLSQDTVLRVLMGRRAKKMWEECFSFDAMVDAYLDLLSSVTGPPVRWGVGPVPHGTG